uniref:Uncharacterized protein n=1 Tax=Lepeophtheirus salmonis TaxID=72036 RepID=A0A0K2U8G2_LEPSM
MVLLVYLVHHTLCQVVTSCEIKLKLMFWYLLH